MGRLTKKGSDGRGVACPVRPPGFEVRRSPKWVFNVTSGGTIRHLHSVIATRQLVDQLSSSRCRRSLVLGQAAQFARPARPRRAYRGGSALAVGPEWAVNVTMSRPPRARTEAHRGPGRSRAYQCALRRPRTTRGEAFTNSGRVLH